MAGEQKKTFALRISAELYEALERWSSDEFRSVNGQLEFLIDKALRDAGRKIRAPKNPKKD